MKERELEGVIFVHLQTIRTLMISLNKKQHGLVTDSNIVFFSLLDKIMENLKLILTNDVKMMQPSSYY